MSDQRLPPLKCRTQIGRGRDRAPGLCILDLDHDGDHVWHDAPPTPSASLSGGPWRTIHEAIAHCEERAAGPTPRRDEWKQIGGWLKELCFRRDEACMGHPSPVPDVRGLLEDIIFDADGLMRFAPENCHPAILGIRAVAANALGALTGGAKDAGVEGASGAGGRPTGGSLVTGHHSQAPEAPPVPADRSANPIRKDPDWAKLIAPLTWEETCDQGRDGDACRRGTKGCTIDHPWMAGFREGFKRGYRMADAKDEG